MSDQAGASIDELPRLSDQPAEILKVVVKLDPRSMVWADDQITSEVDPAGGPIAVVLIVVLIAVIPMWVWALSDPPLGLGVRVAVWALGVPMIALGVVGIRYALEAGLSSSFSDVHFNRLTRKVYTSRNGKLWCLDWDRVRPATYRSPDPQFPASGRRSWGLELIEFSAAKPDAWSQRVAVQGMLADREACQRVWEAIRCYMDDDAARLPWFDVMPGGRGWQSALLEFGPMNDASVFEGGSLTVIQRLRKTHWWPVILPDRWVLWAAWWAGTLLQILYERYRSRPRFPAAWVAGEAPLPDDVNPYRSALRNATEQAGRRKAAAIIGVVCGFCIAAGMAFTAALSWWLVLPVVTGTWHDMFGTPVMGGREIGSPHRTR